jgi:uroporphyrinogen-III synthase
LVSLIAAAGLAPACRALCCFALSPAVAARAATLDWRRIVVAARPDQPAMIDAIVAALCRDPGG